LRGASGEDPLAYSPNPILKKLSLRPKVSIIIRITPLAKEDLIDIWTYTYETWGEK